MRLTQFEQWLQSLQSSQLLQCEESSQLVQLEQLERFVESMPRGWRVSVGSFSKCIGSDGVRDNAQLLLSSQLVQLVILLQFLLPLLSVPMVVLRRGDGVWKSWCCSSGGVVEESVALRLYSSIPMARMNMSDF